MPVIIMDVGGKPGGAFVAGGVRAAVGPLADKGLDKAFGLTIGLGPVGSGVDVLDAVIAANRFDRVSMFPGSTEKSTSYLSSKRLISDRSLPAALLT